MTRSEETHAVIIDQNVKNEGLSIKQEQQTPIPPKKALQAPPALPPKTKIMNSPSRHLFSPSSDITDSAIDAGTYSSSNDTATTVEYIPVREKVKMIAQQQEEIVRREEMKRSKSGDQGVKSRGEGG